MNFIRSVIDLNIQYLFAATRRGMVPAGAAFLFIVLVAGTVAKLMKPTYLAESKLLFKLDRAASLTGLQNPDQGPLTTLTTRREQSHVPAAMSRSRIRPFCR